MMKEMLSTSLLDGGNSAYLEELYETYLRDPNLVPEKWRAYFETLPIVDGKAIDIPHAEIKQYFYQLAHQQGTRRKGPVADASFEHERKQVGVSRLINAYRTRGHQAAKIDPLGRLDLGEVRELELQEYGLTLADMETTFQTGSLSGPEQATLKEIVDILKKTYSSSVGIEFTHISSTTQKEWLQQRMESVCSAPTLEPDAKKNILHRLTAAEGIERYLHSKYVGQKRFSLEGGEGLIVILDEIVKRSGQAGVKELMMCMAHRGRLNVLINIFGKKPSDLFSEFEGKHQSDIVSGDVKYHQGFSSDIATESGSMHAILSFNPSHLEIVSPVALGSARCRQDRHQDKDGSQVLPISIHGDAAFAGQGVVMETFSMSDSRGFSTKGTVHIIVNNQIGFTTSNIKDSRSTLYCTDVAKMINTPIFHVNGDDPEAVRFVTQLALDFRIQFQRDVIIDMCCYRRHGHNEADEPSATQPMMYKHIKALPTTRQLYAQKLVEEQVIGKSDADDLVKYFRDELDAGHCVAPGVIEDETHSNEFTVDWSPYLKSDWLTPYPAAVPIQTIQELGARMSHLPDGLDLHPRVAKIIDDRRKMAAGALPIDWGFGELMGYATLVTDGYGVRLSGQDAGRGTFFHRHAVLHNQKDGSAYIPLRNLAEDQANFLVIDSLLSEEAVMAFEYGYATTDPKTLVIWEAQFGDFANGAQVVIDQFISSAEVKWGRVCGLSLFLPHGYEGQGPEHSSARLERFLQLCADDNMQVLVPSTPAQAYHMIRRQMLRPLRKPMVVMTPKSLLRHKLAVSTLEELAEGTFQNVIDEVEDIAPESVDRLILCSGKVYYDLLQKRREGEFNNAAIVRIEQLYPFPYEELYNVFLRYKNADTIVWCQEEPRNQGAWRSTRHRIEHTMKHSGHKNLQYAGRAASASPAVGQHNIHLKEQEALVEEAFGLRQPLGESGFKFNPPSKNK
ncbi:MAG: 2-oxoglutarate dehydrogenase E1 component [Gammaproteobacteria bacterium]|nr:2-oxoglutarate dehydrogenase E1 component [Gammaproteobacteria bacterium]